MTAETSLATAQEAGLATTAPQQWTIMPQGVPAEFRMADEERAELDGYNINPLIIQFDGQAGRFRNVETEAKYDELTGVILGSVDGQVWFGPDVEKKPDEKRWGWPKWICRASNSKGSPTLNRSMTPEQRAEATRRGAGKNCASCPLRQWSGDNKPVCDQKIQLVWFDEQTMQVCIVPSGGKSIKGIRRYIGSFLREGVALYGYVTRLSPEEQTEDIPGSASRRYYTIKTERVRVMEVDHFRSVAAIRKSLMPSLDRQLEHAAAVEDEAPATAHAEPESAPQAPARAASSRGTQRGLVLTEEGEVFPAEPFPEEPPPPSDDDFTPGAGRLPF